MVCDPIAKAPDGVETTVHVASFLAAEHQESFVA